MVTLQLLPYSELEGLSSVGKIRKLLNIAKEDKIVLLQGRLTSEEEAELIKVTMEEINSEFKGIELAVINSDLDKLAGLSKLKHSLANAILGDRSGLTIIGPATIVKKIKQDPDKIELLTRETTRKKRKK